MKYTKKIIHHQIDNLIEIKLDNFTDNRGEIWSIYEECDLLPKFVEDKVTISKKNVLRGLHGDYETYKLITCLHGKIFLVVADVRNDSPTYLRTKTFYVSDDNPTMILVPPGCLNGHLCLSEKCVFFYKWSNKYEGPEKQLTISWNDPKLKIKWPINNPVLSLRDTQATNL